LETGDTSDAKDADVASADHDDARVTTEEKDAGTQSSSSDESDKNNEVSPSGNLSKLEKYPRFKLTC